MILLGTRRFLLSLAQFDGGDSLYTDFSDTSKIYDRPIPMISRGPDDFDLLKTWKKRQLPPGKKIYQLGVEVPTSA